jgi:apolipoprotein N-acyltransferase
VTGATNLSATVRRALLALVSGGLYAAAQPGIGWWPLAWIALVPLLLGASGARPLAGAALGALFAVAAAFGVSAWLPAMITGYFAAPSLAGWPLALLAWLAFAALPFAGFGAWLAWACGRGPVAALAMAAAFTLCEYARANAVPVANPWALLAVSQTAWPPAVQSAALGGPWAPGFVVAAGNALLAGLLARRLRGKRPRLGAAAVVGLLIASGVHGLAQLQRDRESGATLRVALANAAIEPVRRYAPEFVADNLARQLAVTRAAVDSAPDVVFWPELALDFHVQTDTRLRQQILAAVPTGGVELVAGGLGLRHAAAGGAERLNSVFLFRDAALLGHTDKVLLMPFSETMPMGRLLGLGPDPYVPGARPRLLHLRQARAGVAICSEAMHPGYVRRVVQAGAELLVNPSQDGWFGSVSAARQQLAAARLRAIETRRFLLRPVAGGFAAVIDPEGRIVATSRYAEPGVVSARVHARSDTTLYVRAGDWLPALALAALLSDGIGRCFRRIAPPLRFRLDTETGRGV